jgi:hypothetical protein
MKRSNAYLVDMTYILVFTETHGTPANPTIERMLPAFRCFATDRNSSLGRGGAAVFLRNELASHVATVHNTRIGTGGEIVWIRLRNPAADTAGKTILIGAVYLAPENSKVHRQGADGSEGNCAEVAAEVFEELRSQLATIRQNKDDVVLLGDFNARVATPKPGASNRDDRGVCDLPDVEGLSDLQGRLGVGLFTPGVYDGVQTHRCYEDKKVNEFGLCLGRFCQAQELIIVNGCIPGDPTGALTCPHDEGGSMIDLCLVTPELLVKGLDVVVHTRWFLTPAKKAISDHRAISISFGDDPAGPKT